MGLSPTLRSVSLAQTACPVVWGRGGNPLGYVSTPLPDQGRLWLVNDGGIVTQLDAATGQRLQEERLPGGRWLLCLRAGRRWQSLFRQRARGDHRARQPERVESHFLA